MRNKEHDEYGKMHKALKWLPVESELQTKPRRKNQKKPTTNLINFQAAHCKRCLDKFILKKVATTD